MASQFIGLHMVVTLRNPVGMQVQGKISDIAIGDSANGQRNLILSDAFVIGSGHKFPRLELVSDNILDLNEVPHEPQPATFTAPVVSGISAPMYQQTSYQQTQPAFEDPAILSVGARPAVATKDSAPYDGTVTAGEQSYNQGAGAAQAYKQQDAGSGAQQILPGLVITPVSMEEGTPEMQAAMENLQIDNPSTLAHQHQHQSPVELEATSAQETTANRRTRRGGRKKTGGAPRQVELQESGGQGDDSPPSLTTPANRGKGWRQTPILESTAAFPAFDPSASAQFRNAEVSPTSSSQPFASLQQQGQQEQKQPEQRNWRPTGRGGKKKKKKKIAATADNGWASEDVTEEMGEFDFEGSLAKFDKRTLFDQMRRQDKIDDSERLVSHNRRPRPGTGGGRNLHHTENVLDMPSSLTLVPKPATAASNSNDFWASEADDGTLLGGEEEGRIGGREARSSQSSRRADSKSTVARRAQSRKASVVPAPGQPLSRVNSSMRQLGSNAGGGVDGAGPKYQILQRGHTPKPHAAAQHLQQQEQPGFYLVPSGRRVEPVSSLQMLNLENIAANEIGLTEDIMTENAGRGIAEVTLKALADPAIGLRMGTSGRSTPIVNVASHATIAILAGNNKSGIRAIAAGRHLRSKGANVLICLVGAERERDLLEDMRQQVRIYRSLGGRVFSKPEFFEHLRRFSPAAGGAEAEASGGGVSLVIDALLGLTISFEELRTGDQASVYELMEWANRNEAFVLAVDVPAGIDATSGKVNVIDGSRLFVKPRYVVAMGAPKRGLLEAMCPDNEDGVAAAVEGADGIARPLLAEDERWRLYVADIGLGPGVWKKGGTKMRRGIDFDDKWVLEMRYEGVTEEGDDEDEGEEEG